MTRSIRWGIAWAIAGGFWLLAPLIVSTHHLSVTTFLGALPVVGMLVILFAFIGAVLSVPIHAFVWLARRIIRRPSGDPEWSAAITTGILLVPAYWFDGSAIYAKRFGLDDAPSWSANALRIALPVILTSTIFFLALHWITSGKLRQRRIAIAAAIAGSAFVSGAAALLIKLPQVAGPATQAQALPHIARPNATRHRLLLIGVDGASWRPIEPLVKAGRMPNLAKLIDTGTHGNMIAIWPPHWSTTAWSAIITGLPREQVGVYGDLMAKVPGLPAFQAPLDIDPRLILVSAIEFGLAYRHLVKASPPERSALKRPPVWETLEKSGVRTGVIRFNFSYPASHQASVVISNRVVADMWNLLGVKNADPKELVWPDSMRDTLLSSFDERWTPPTDEADRILSEEVLEPLGSDMKPVKLLRRVLGFDQRTVHAAVELVKEDSTLEVLIIHLGGLDNVEHVFWEYRFPEDFKRKPQQKDIAVLGPVIDRYAEWVDKGIGEIIAAYPEQPDVMVISDHGMGSFENRPPFKGWHVSPGIFVGSGPGFAHDNSKIDVSYYDIVPTILDLKGLVKPSNLKGRSIARQ